MKRFEITKVITNLAIMGLLGTPGLAGAVEIFNAKLTGFQEVPALSTAASGQFIAIFDGNTNTMEFDLDYSGLEGAVTQAHIHFGQRGVAGGISIWLCANTGSPPAGTPACPDSPATVTGTLDANDVVGPTAQGIEAAALAELLAAMRAGISYVNVHSVKFTTGEIRGQLRPN